MCRALKYNTYSSKKLDKLLIFFKEKIKKINLFIDLIRKDMNNVIPRMTDLSISTQ
jgi:hypothetical protein